VKTPRHLRELARAATQQGWEIRHTRGNHICFESPKGEPVFCACTPSDYRATKNLIAKLRRSGMEI